LGAANFKNSRKVEGPIYDLCFILFLFLAQRRNIFISAKK